MTNEQCQAACGRLGFQFAATEYYSECHCSQTFNGDNGIAATADCNTPCRGDSSQMCGGPNRITAWGFDTARGPDPIPVESATSTTPTKSANTDSPATTTASTSRKGWKYMGCYTDLADNIRTFDQGLAVPGGTANMTNANCQAACLQRGFKYCGTEYAFAPELTTRR